MNNELIERIEEMLATTKAVFDWRAMQTWKFGVFALAFVAVLAIVLLVEGSELKSSLDTGVAGGLILAVFWWYVGRAGMAVYRWAAARQTL